MISRNRTTGVLTIFAALAAVCCPASADAGDFAGTWVNNTPADGGFFSNLIGGGKTSDEIGRIVVTPAGANAVRVHLYGRCEPECDWGSALARNHAAAPQSDDVAAVVAEFNTGAAAKRLTLRKGPGHTLTFEVVTDFTDHSARHDYIASGLLRLVPPPVAVAIATSTGAAPAPVAAAAPAPRAETGDDGEDCVRINPEDIFVAPPGRSWKVNDFNHTILDFGTDKVAAVKASRVLEYYRFDEQCYINRPRAKMIYWRIGGAFPREAMPGADCVDLRTEALQRRGGQVLDGDRVVLDFDDDATAASKALGVLKTYRITQQCFVARPNQTMVYWLAK